MKTIIKKCKNLIIKFFSAYFKNKKMEALVISRLTYYYTEWTLSKNNEELLLLVNLVNFCNQVGINGSTEDIKKIILDAWNLKTLSKK